MSTRNWTWTGAWAWSINCELWLSFVFAHIYNIIYILHILCRSVVDPGFSSQLPSEPERAKLWGRTNQAQRISEPRPAGTIIKSEKIYKLVHNILMLSFAQTSHHYSNIFFKKLDKNSNLFWLCQPNGQQWELSSLLWRLETLGARFIIIPSLHRLDCSNHRRLYSHYCHKVPTLKYLLKN